MITQAIMAMGLGVARWLLSLLPLASSDIIGWLDAAVPYLSWVGNFVDVAAWATVASIAIAYEIAMIAVRVGLWVWRRLPLGG